MNEMPNERCCTCNSQTDAAHTHTHTHTTADTNTHKERHAGTRMQYLLYTPDVDT